jgi:prepilin-type N-terminal cleavage/methylation domain-containing protein
MHLKNQNGFSLIEIMVAMSLMASLSVVGMQMFKNQSTAAKTVEQNYEVTTIHNQIRNVLANEANCTATFMGQPPEGGSTTRIIKDGQPAFNVGQDVASGVKVLSYTLGNPGNIAVVAGKETILNIKYSRGKGTLRDETGKNLKVVYELSGATIVKCYVFSNQDDTYWMQSDIDSNDIYYGSPSVGDVGVGTEDPQHKFHVVGTEAAAGLVNFTATGNRGGFDRATVSLAPSLAPTQSFIHLFGKADNSLNSAYIGYRHVQDSTENNVMTFGIHSRNNLMTLKGNGNFGIGPEDPQSKLHVEKNFNGVTNQTASFIGGVDAGFTNTGVYVLQKAGNAFGHRSTKLMNVVLDNTSVLTVTGERNVGVNTVDPLRGMHVSGATSGELILENTSSNANFRKWNISSEGPSSENADLAFRQLTDAGAGGAVPMVIDGATANVGINDSEPAQKLTVGGSVQIGGNVATSGISPSLYFGQDFNNTDTMRIYRQNVGSDVTNMVFLLGDNPTATMTDSWIFSSGAATPAMHVMTDGRVGINRANPTVALEVGGRVKVDPHSNLSSMPGGWAGIHTWDLFSEATIAAGSGGTARIEFNANGNGRIGGDLNVEGSLYSNSFMYTSDARLKKNVSTIENPLEKILALRGVNFTWIKKGNEDIGFIAQEVETVEPRLVGTDKNGTKSVKYGNIIAIVVEAIKELFSEQKELRDEVSELKAQNELLKARLDAQDKLIRDLASKN